MLVIIVSIENNVKVMKRRPIVLVLFAVACLLGSCNVERSEKYQSLLAERDSLYTEAVAAKGGFDQALNTINEIEEALESVRAAESIIMVENQEGNTQKAVSQINAIQQTLQENRNKINDLEKRLNEQGSKSKALAQTVTRLKTQLEEKDNFIASLKTELQSSREQITELNNQVADLNDDILTLNDNIESLNEQNAAQQATIDSQVAALNTVWICIAPAQTLKEKGIITRGGLFQPSELSKQGLDKSQFMQSDKRQLTQIPLNTTRAKVMSNHPESSYELIENEVGALVLDIKDQDSFWSVSNYLVVSIK